MNDTPSKQLAPIEHFKLDLHSRQQDIKDVLPPQIPVEKFIRTTLTAVSMNPDLMGADRKSLLGSTMKAAQDGLLCDGREAALVIFNGKEKDANGKETWIKKVQYMPMVAGILKKIRNSGEVSNITVSVVYEKDEFSYTKGDDETIVHKPYLDGDPGAVRFAYAIAKLKDGTLQREVMPRYQIDRVRQSSRSKDSGPWVSWYDEMARKTVLRRLSKYLPSSTDIENIFAHDNENYELRDVTPQLPSAVANINAQIEQEKKTRKPRSKPAVIDGETGEILDGGDIQQTGATQSVPDTMPAFVLQKPKFIALQIVNGQSDIEGFVKAWGEAISAASSIEFLDQLKKLNDKTLNNIGSRSEFCLQLYDARQDELMRGAA